MRRWIVAGRGLTGSIAPAVGGSLQQGGDWGWAPACVLVLARAYLLVPSPTLLGTLRAA